MQALRTLSLMAVRYVLKMQGHVQVRAVVGVRGREMDSHVTDLHEMKRRDRKRTALENVPEKKKFPVFVTFREEAKVKRKNVDNVQLLNHKAKKEFYLRIPFLLYILSVSDYFVITARVSATCQGSIFRNQDSIYPPDGA